MKKFVEITVVEAEELPVGDANGLSDPYVTIDFCPGQLRLLKTSVKPETLNPKWVRAQVRSSMLHRIGSRQHPCAYVMRLAFALDPLFDSRRNKEAP